MNIFIFFVLFFNIFYCNQLYSIFAKQREKIVIILADEQTTNTYAVRYKNILINSKDFLKEFIQEYQKKLSDDDREFLEKEITKQSNNIEEICKKPKNVYEDVSSQRDNIEIIIKRLHDEYAKKNIIEEIDYNYLEIISIYLHTLERAVSQHCIKINAPKKAAL